MTTETAMINAKLEEMEIPKIKIDSPDLPTVKALLEKIKTSENTLLEIKRIGEISTYAAAKLALFKINKYKYPL